MCQDRKNLHQRVLEYVPTSRQQQDVEYSEHTKCDFLEILQYGSSEGTIFRERSGELNDSSLEEWISQNATSFASTEPGVTGFLGGLRLIFGTCHFHPETGARQLPFTRETFAAIKTKIELPEDIIQCRSGRAIRLSRQADWATPDFEPSSRFLFKLAKFRPSYYNIALSYDQDKKLTYGLLLSKRCEGHDFPSITRSLHLSRQYSTNPLLLPILVAKLCIESSSKKIYEVGCRLNNHEEAIGQHEWLNRPRGDPWKVDFLAVTRNLNFLSRLLGKEAMRVSWTLLALQKMKESRELGAKSQRPDSATEFLRERAECHIDECHNLAPRIEYEERRIKTQIAVVYQFMAQKDAKVNIQLAETTATIALESKKDSSAMKAIAVLTMCFLPGTFLAAIFAMPMFDWNGDGAVIKDEFKYYWALAIPLTAGVLFVWVICLFLPWRTWVSKFKMKQKCEDPEEARLVTTTKA